MKKMSANLRIIAICSLVLFLLAPTGTAFAGVPAGINYTVTILTNNVSGNTATLTGTASASPYKGNLNQQHFDIDWGDPSPNVQNYDSKYVIAGNDIGGNLTFNWSESHVYTDGVYTAKVTLYHQNPQGAEASATDEITIAVDKGVLTVIKNVAGSTDLPSTFQLNVSGNGVDTDFAGSGTGEELILDPATYTVSEGEYANFTTTYGGACNGSGNVTIASGEFKTCTVTNTYQAPPEVFSLRVVKVVKNDNGGTKLPADFTINVSGNSPSPTSFPGVDGDGAGTLVSIGAGAYSVAEDSVAGYEAEYGADCTGTFSSGDGEKTCTITNDDIMPILTVTKLVINDNEGTADVKDFNLYVTNTDNLNKNQVWSGQNNTFPPGPYQISEDQKEGYTSSFSGDCDASGLLTINLADNKSCTIVNNDISPEEPTTGTIIVTKIVVNDNGGTKLPSDFTMNVTATDPSKTSFAGSSSGEAVTVAPGAYSIDETAVTGYAKTLGEGCSGTIAAGDTVTCTITNDDVAPTLTVIKEVINDGGGTMQVSNFPLYVCAVVPQDTAYAKVATLETVFLGPCPNQVVSGVINTYSPGAYVVSEINNASYIASFSGDCDIYGNVTLNIGETKTCKITNNDPGVFGNGSSGSGGSGGGGGSYYRPTTTTPTPAAPTAPAVTTPTEPTSPDEGEVLGEQACSAYMTEYIHIRKKNNPDEVKKLKLFLNEYMDLNLVVDGDYDTIAFEAVVKFQKKEYAEILAPWGIKKPTGYVYKTTLRRINMIKCSDLNLPVPSPLVRDKNIHDNL